MGGAALPIISIVAGLGSAAGLGGMSGGGGGSSAPEPTAPDTSAADAAAAEEEKKRRAAAAEENKTNYTGGLGVGDEADIYKTTLG